MANNYEIKLGTKVGRLVDGGAGSARLNGDGRRVRRAQPRRGLRQTLPLPPPRWLFAKKKKRKIKATF